MKDIDEDTFYMYCCYFILGSYYGYPIQGGGAMKLEIFNKDQGLMRTYKMGINADMSEIYSHRKGGRNNLRGFSKNWWIILETLSSGRKNSHPIVGPCGVLT